MKFKFFGSLVKFLTTVLFLHFSCFIMISLKRSLMLHTSQILISAFPHFRSGLLIYVRRWNKFNVLFLHFSCFVIRCLKRSLMLQTSQILISSFPHFRSGLLIFVRRWNKFNFNIGRTVWKSLPSILQIFDNTPASRLRLRSRYDIGLQ